MSRLDPNNYDKWFVTSTLSSDLKSKSIKGGFNTVIGQIISFILNIASTIVMARLLMPGDYGLVAMVTSITGFITIFKDMGLSEAIVQRKSLQQSQVSAVFWINTFLSLSIALIVASISPLLVSFYREERLMNMTLVFAATIFLTGLSLQHNALMKRQMMFNALSKIQVFSTILSIFIGILFAWKGFGYWAIVAAMVSNSVLYTIFLWITCDWRPDLNFKKKGVKSLIKFGAGITGFSLANYFSRNMDNVLIGKFSGSSVLGVYTKAYQLLLLPITQLRDPLNAVALPALSSLQNDKWKFNQYFKRYLFTLAFFSMPIVIYCAIFSDEIILIVLGANWMSASYIFKLLSITAFIQPIASAQGLLLITTGKSKKYFYLGVMNSIVTVISFCIGINWGVTGIAVSYAIVNYAVFIPFLLFCLNGSPINTVYAFLEEIILPASFSLITGVVLYLFRLWLININPFAICIIGFFIGITIYLLLWLFTKYSRQRLNQILELGKIILNKSKVGLKMISFFNSISYTVK